MKTKQKPSVKIAPKRGDTSPHKTVLLVILNGDNSFEVKIFVGEFEKRPSQIETSFKRELHNER